MARREAISIPHLNNAVAYVKVARLMIQAIWNRLGAGVPDGICVDAGERQPLHAAAGHGATSASLSESMPASFAARSAPRWYLAASVVGAK
jgi:hypothetical protein